jgi:hypothetical protein
VKGDAQDRRASQALVTGTLAAMLTQYAANPDKGVAIEDVQLDADERGNYRPSLTLTMSSGTVFKVLVIDDTP